MSILSLSRFVMACPGRAGGYLWITNNRFDQGVRGADLRGRVGCYNLLFWAHGVRFQMKESL